MFVIKLADITIGIDNRYPYIEALACDYIVDEPPVFTAFATDDDIERERHNTDEELSEGYLEGIAIHRKIAERLPEYNAVVFHGAVLTLDGSAYAFAAKSGVGKTTHTRLWIDEFADARYLNGDKPVIRLVNGAPMAYGSPWCGKEGYGVNGCAPLRSIALIERADINTAEVIDPYSAAIGFINQIYIPQNPKCATLAMRIADRIISSVRFVRLGCNMDREAARVAARAMII